METPESEFSNPGEPRNPGPFNDRRMNGEVVSLKDAAMDVASSVSDLYEVSSNYIQRQAAERPYVMLGAAAGIGFILGGGLASRLAGVLLTATGRVLAAELMQSSSTDRGSPRSVFVSA
jgi:hypothetical protein